MREKDHSPRKMLPSPKLGSVYPLAGANSLLSSNHVPFDLSNRSSSSNLLHQQQTALDQPLDLRVEKKKFVPSLLRRSNSDSPMEDENSNVIKRERSLSPLSSNNNNNNNTKLSNKNYLTVKDDLRIPGLPTHNQPLFPPPSLHPLVLGELCFYIPFSSKIKLSINEQIR